MATAKHTPAGQIRLTATVGTTGTIENPLFWSIEKVDDYGMYLGGLAHVHGRGDVSREERDANAKLFLAAPTLLEALEALVAEICDYAKINNLSYPESKHNIKLARAAIAKAKGEA